MNKYDLGLAKNYKNKIHLKNENPGNNLKSQNLTILH
jgi:hypothetical protein